MPRLTINGVGLYYEEHGSGPPLMLLHGFAGTAAMWAPQVEPLSSAHRLIVYDMRGHGRSAAPYALSDYSLDIVVEDHYQLMRALGLERAVIGGLSLGGFVSLHFQARHPDMVAGLILADTGAGYRGPGPSMDQTNQVWRRTAEVLVAGGIESYVESPLSALTYYSTAEVMRGHSAIGLTNVSLGVMTNPVRPPLEEIGVPTLVLCGERDAPFLPLAEDLHRHIPGAEKAIIPRAGHASNLDQPAAFNRLVLDFLHRHHL